MIRAKLLTGLLVILPLQLNSQILKGRITNESGDAVPYATVYIREFKLGTTANTKGDYEIRLEKGKYQVTYQSLGYGPVLYDVTISDQPVTRNVVLPLQYYMIPEVRITATGEDPAYGIMRKAIGMAPFYNNSISYYKADVYLKGNIAVNKIPKLLQRAIRVEAKKNEAEGGTSVTIKEGDSYLMESYNEIEFTAPDRYVQKVISVNSTFPENQDEMSPMDFVNASFYQPLIADLAISPLSPQAFSYYKFQYLGATPQGNVTINKIRVIPRMKSQQLFEGTIYIIEDLWCLQSVDLTNDNIAGKINVKQLFIPVRDDIWMPVSYNFVMNISIVGVRADAGYTGSVKYLEVKPNISLQKPASVTTDPFGKQAQPQVEPAVSKNRQKIEEILQKDELNNRDMVRLSKLMDQESKESRPDSIKKTLEIKDKTITTVEKDANKKDSTYWAEIRPVPLSDLEIKSIRQRDSINALSALKKSSHSASDTSARAGENEKRKAGQTIRNIAFGHSWSDTTGFSFNFGGLLDMQNLSFNTVDGFKYGINFRMTKSWKDRNSLVFAPDLRWAFSREKLLWRINGSYSFNRMKQRSVSFNTGVVSKDISTGGSINTFLNSISSLFFEKNYLKLYESRFVSGAFRTELRNGLNITLFAGYDNRKALENTTDFSFVNTPGEYTINIPDNPYLDSTSNPINAIRDQRHLDFGATVVYTPMQRYSIWNGGKVNRGSDWPTFSITWKHGINEFPGMNPGIRHYDMIMVDVSRNRDIGAFTEIRWRVRSGGFLNNTSVQFFDFFHFNAQPLPVLLDDYRDAFRLPAYYSLSTPEFFGEAHLKYTTPYLFLKYLPGLSKTLMRENLSLSYLGSRYHTNYTELGYSITEFLLVGELGIYLGFDDLKYRSIGARLVLRLN